MLYILDLFGVIVFAITGSLVARRKQLDVFGVAVIAFVTAVGGGTLRDIILDITPVFWVNDPMYVIFSLIGVVLTVILIRFNLLPHQPLLIADAFGLAVFTVIGTQVALDAEVNWGIAIIMGVMSSVAGGIIRDILSDDIPLVLRKEIYATASLCGASIYIILLNISLPIIAITVSILFTLTLRLTAIWRRWSLPMNLIGFSENSS
ncbi:MAG: trimeric intracellular cation channel family protein [Phototrophicaceae bacterium]